MSNFLFSTSKGRRGFTIIEATMTVTIIAMLAGILLLAARRAVSSSRIAAEREVVRSLSMAVVKFKEDFRFLPPLIDDHLDGNGNTMGNVINAQGIPDVRDDVFLASGAGSDLDAPRYSIYSLQWYLMGALDTLIPNPQASGTPTPLDGAAGPRLTTPNRDGTFKRSGKAHDALYDPSRAGPKHVFGVYPAAAEPSRIALTDRWGQPLRYYRWKPQFAPPPGGQVSQYLVPRSAGDPATNPELRGAEFAIVSLGPDGQTDVAASGFDKRPLPTSGNVTGAVDAAPLASTVKDNIVEVGR